MVPFKGDLWRPTSRKTPRMVVLGSRAALAAAILCASATVASTTVAFTSIPALNLPALQAKRAISPTLREFRLALGEGSATEATSSSHTRRQALQHGVVTIGGIALTMSAGAADAVNRLKSDLRVLVIGNVYPCNPGHPVTPSKVATPLRRKAENYTSKQ